MSLANQIEGGSGQVSQTQPDGLADSLIRVNGLSYRMPSNMSVVVSRNMKRSFANLDSYKSGGKIIITWNSGSEYVNGMNSYLTFDAAVVGAAGATASLESGSATNFIESVTVNSIQGTEVDRTEGVGIYRRDIDRYTYSQDYLNNIGSVMGYATTESGVTNLSNTVKDEAQPVTRYCIPLSKICGLCNTSVLIPSMLSGGLRFEIKLASFGAALKVGATVPTDYKLTNVSMQLDSFQLADSIQKRLMQESAASGLEFFYETWDRTRHNISASTKANITVRKAVSRALSAHAKTRLTANTNLSSVDSMASEAVNAVSKMSWRLGSLNFPNAPLESQTEQYYYAQYAFGKLEHPHKSNSISLTDFTGNEGLVAVTLERSSVLSLSGLPVNNSRTLQLELDYSTPATRDIDVFLNYLQLARVFPNNVLVKE
jgi:hypothetical protein